MIKYHTPKFFYYFIFTFFLFSFTIHSQERKEDFKLEDSYFDAILIRDWKKTDSIGKILEKEYLEKNKLADLQYYKGFEYFHREEYKTALDYYLKARKLYIEKKNLNKQAEVESAIVEVIGYFDKGLVEHEIYLNSLCELGKTLNNKTVLWDCEYYKGYFKEVEGKFSDALKHYKATSEITLKFNDTLAYYTTQINVGKMLLAVKKYDQGLKVLSNVESYYSRVGNIGRNFLIHLHKSEGYKSKKNFNKALQELDKARSIVDKNPSLHDYFDLYDRYSLVYEETRQYKKALKYDKLKQVYKDSINYVKADQDIYQLKVKYDVVEKDNKIITLENENLVLKVQENRNIILLLIISNALFAVLIILFFLNKRYQQNKKEIAELQELIDSFNQKMQEKESKSTNQRIILKNNSLLNSENIMYVKSDGHYVEYFLFDSKPVLDRNTMSGVLEVLPSLSFVRIHKSFIVNIERIKIINSTQIMLDNGQWIPLSRTYKQELKDILNKQ